MNLRRFMESLLSFFFACIGTMNRDGALGARLWSKTQPQRSGCSRRAAAGAEHTAALQCPGSWRASVGFLAPIGTMNLPLGRGAVVPAAGAGVSPAMDSGAR